VAINVRTKGQEGEREFAKILNDIVAQVRHRMGYPVYKEDDKIFQRNQNQSAVGGDDLSNPVKLAIEIKRQEALSVGAWWKQCVASAERTGGIPILAYRQNRKKWNVVMKGAFPLEPDQSSCYVTMDGIAAQMDLDSFRAWFRAYYERKLEQGYHGDQKPTED